MKRNLRWSWKVILVLIVIIGGSILWNNYQKNIEEETNDNYHNEFNVVNSNYIDKYYERYVEYKVKHPEYSDDTIITYVNIGLDNDFYTNMEYTDMNDGILVLCNKYHMLKSDYVPNLVSLSGYGGGQMQKEAAEYFKKMVDDAKNDGIKLYNVSGYRSYNTQKNLYNNYVKKDGVKKADTYSARAGSSEHQTGLATDINTANSSDHFERTKEYAWLIKNSYKYGFILRYPEGKTFITGYKYEPWHYRYVGEKVAKEIYDLDITYEEYYATYILKG
jgi:D-alanyl-D-alanine carboxypeptidase